jgi:ferredoxin-NADP reductase
MKHIVKVRSVKNVTHNVLGITTDKPESYSFIPGQATDISINKDGWKDQLRPFTFTCLPSDDQIEFNIKTYPDHKGVTNELLKLKGGDELILHDVFGEIAYKGEGIFIAGGAGVTPFIAILRHLRSNNEVGNNKLIFANKAKADIILEAEFKELLGDNFVNVLSDEIIEGYEYGYITEALLAKNLAATGGYFYLCGPPPMMDAIEKQLANLKIPVEFIIKEGF